MDEQDENNGRFNGITPQDTSTAMFVAVGTLITELRMSGSIDGERYADRIRDILDSTGLPPRSAAVLEFFITLAADKKKG